MQDNHSLSAEVGTLRGLHFQIAAVRAGQAGARPRGRILDVAVDMRRGSPTYGRMSRSNSRPRTGASCWFRSASRTASSRSSPTPRCSTRSTRHYSPRTISASPGTIPRSAIAWPAKPAKPVLSDKDGKHPRLRDLKAYFE